MAEAENYSRFFEVKVELFDGPIDLLLHLVKKRELPIEKVSLSEVCAQYLECIKGLRYYDVEVAAEYLVIAATLLSVKASTILNEPVELVVDENGDLVDPHEELVLRLKELETFRAAAQDLGARPHLGLDVFAPPVKGNKIDPKLIPLADHQSELLVKAFHAVLARMGEKASVFSITIDPVSVIERMRRVVDSLKSFGGSAKFSDLLVGVTDRASAIGVFCALLELCRRRMVGVFQEGPRAEISIRLSDGTEQEKLPVEEEAMAEVAA
jgi:segregation and condensation protein A